MKTNFLTWLLAFCLLFTPFVGLHAEDLSNQWFSFSMGLPENVSITCIASNPIDHSIMIGTNLGVYMSLDFGETWEEKSLGLSDKEIQCIFFEEINRIYYAGTKQGGVFRFIEIANKWSSFNTNLPSKNIQVITSSKQFLYAGTKTDGLFRVKLGSEKWIDLNFDDKNPVIKTCEYRGILPVSDQIILCATTKGLLITDNSGENWRLMEDNSLLGSPLLSISMDSQKPNRLLIGTEAKGLIESQDQGKTWKEINGSFGKGKSAQFHSIVFNPKQPKTIFIASFETVFVSIDDGKTWKPAVNGLENSVINIISLLSSNNENYLCAGTGNAGFFVLRNNKPPFKPTSLKAQMKGSFVLLTWTASLQGSGKVMGYNIYKKKDKISQSFEKIATATDLAFIDNQVSWNEKLIYQVTAIDDSNPPLESNPSSEVSILVDDLPLIQITEPKDGLVTELSQLAIKGTILDQGSGVAESTLIIKSETDKTDEYPLSLKSDGSFVQMISLAMGTNEIKIIARDNNNMTADLTISILRKTKEPDKTPPEIITNQPINGFIVEEDVLIVSGTIKDTESGVFDAKIWNTVNGNRIGSKVITLNQEGFFLEKLPVQVGENTISIQAIDGSGNMIEKKITGTVRKPDLVPPTLVILEPANGFTTEENTIPIRGRSVDDNSGIESTIVTLEYLGKVMYEKNIKLDKDGFFSETLSLMEGENLFTIIAKDKRNNQTKVIIKGTRIPKSAEILIILQIGSKKASINGEEKLLQAAPEIKKGKTYVPVRFMAETFGANVNWVPSRKEIQITYQDIYITLWLNQTIISIESLTDITKAPVTKFLETPPYLLSGVTMVPLRFIIEEWKTELVWDKDTQQIKIHFKK
jgi:photosystem II stability/assembly factor-like uncharacterized protein